MSKASWLRVSNVVPVGESIINLKTKEKLTVIDVIREKPDKRYKTGMKPGKIKVVRG